MPITVGLIGAGRVARYHLAACVRSPYVQAVSLAEPVDHARRQTERRFGIIKRVHSDYQEMLADPQIRVIDICTPNHLHHDQAIAALQAGKDVICEAPLAINLAEADEMIAAAADADRRLFCCLNQRFIPAHIRARELLTAGEIGQPFFASTTVFADLAAAIEEPGDWRADRACAGGGIVLDAGYHAISVLQHLFGPAQAVSATLRVANDDPGEKVEDTAALVLSFAGGMLAQVSLLGAAAGDRPTAERRIVGVAGSLLIRDNPEDEMPLVVLQGDDFHPVKLHRPLEVYEYSIEQTVEHFLECLAKDRSELVTVAEARLALATVLTAYRSHQQGQRLTVNS